MNQYVTGAAIKQLREKKKLTQAGLAEMLNVSDKAISKWETGKGFPDISLLEPLASSLGVSLAELLSGSSVINSNVAANMLKTRFYVCPVCGNVIASAGEALVSCHGVQLQSLESEPCDGLHNIKIERVEDEFYVSIAHEMTKKHYISFIAGLSDEGIELKKLYPEQEAATRLKIRGTRKIFFFCNKDGLFAVDILRERTKK